MSRRLYEIDDALVEAVREARRRQPHTHDPRIDDMNAMRATCDAEDALLAALLAAAPVDVDARIAAAVAAEREACATIAQREIERANADADRLGRVTGHLNGHRTASSRIAVAIRARSATPPEASRVVAPPADRTARDAGLGGVTANPTGECACEACSDERAKNEPPLHRFTRNFRYACERCGNKRCPHHADHRFECTGSNEPGQVGKTADRAARECERSSTPRRDCPRCGGHGVVTDFAAQPPTTRTCLNCRGTGSRP